MLLFIGAKTSVKKAIIMGKQQESGAPGPGPLIRQFQHSQIF